MPPLLLRNGMLSSLLTAWRSWQVNKEEDDAPCAAREVRWRECPRELLAVPDAPCASQVYEETGFDISDFIVDADFVETMHAQQQTKLFIVADIDEQARMQQCAHAPLCPARI